MNKNKSTEQQNTNEKTSGGQNKNPSRSSDPHNPNDPDFQKNQPYAGENNTSGNS